MAWMLIATLCAPLAGAHTGFAPQRHVVEIQGFAFVPETLRVSPGDTVVWVNRDIVPHTVTASNEAWDSGPLDAGQSWELVVEDPPGAAGGYFCRYHADMQGALEAPVLQVRSLPPP